MAEPITGFLMFVGSALAGTGAVGGLGWFIAANAAMIANVLVFSSLVGVAAYQKRKQKKQSAHGSMQDRFVMLQTVDGPRSRIYGQVRNVDGILFKASHGPNNSFYTLVVAFSGHQIDGYEEIYFDDAQVTLAAADGNGWQYVQTAPWAKTNRQTTQAVMTVTNGSGSVVLPNTPVSGSVSVIQGSRVPVPFNLVGNTVSVSGFGTFTGTLQVFYQYDVVLSRVRVRLYDGSPTQDLGPLLAAQGISTIDASRHRFRGIACAIVQMEFDKDAFPTGVPQVTARMRGARVFDPRSGQTVYTDNPALIARDWALYAYGGGIPATAIDGASFITAANACDVSTTFTTPQGSAVLPLYTAGIVCRTDEDPWAAFLEMVEAMAGKAGWPGGLLRVKAGVYSAPVDTLTEDWLSGKEDIQIVREQPTDEAVNIARPTIANRDEKHVVMPAPEVRAAAYISLDGQELPREVPLAAVTDIYHSQHICGVQMRDERNGLTMVIPCNMRAFRPELFDTIAVTLPRFGMASKEFQILGWQFSLNGGIVLTLKETAAAIFQPDAGFSAQDLTPNTNLPDPSIVPQVGTLTVSSGTATLTDGSVLTRTLVQWPAVADQAVIANGSVEVQYAVAEDPLQWQSVKEPGSATETVINGLKSSYIYIFRARAMNAMGVNGAWSTHAAHLIAEPPSFDYEDLDGRPAMYRVVAVGSFSTQHPIAGGLYNAEDNSGIDTVLGRSYRVHVFDRGTGNLISSTTYDVFASATNANTMATALNAMGSNRIVVIRTWDDAQTNRLTTNLKTAMLRCGASNGVYGSPQVKFRSAYILIGMPGCGEGNGFEMYQGAVDSDTNAWCDVTFSLKSGNLIVSGSGATPRTLQDYGFVGDLNATFGADWNSTLTGKPSDGELINFRAIKTWEFANTSDGWQGNGMTVTNNADSVTLTSNSTDPTFHTVPGFAIPGSQYATVRVRIRRIAGTGWQGDLFYITDGHVHSSSFYKNITAQPGSTYTVLEWDMSTLTAGGSDWVTNIIRGIRFDFGTTAADIFEVDWVSIGKRAVPGDLQEAAAVTLVPRGQCVTHGNTITKIGGSSAWDSDCYSTQGFTGGAFMSVRMPQTNRDITVGLNRDPLTDQSFGSIDVCFVCRSTGVLEIYENGLGAGTFGTYAIGDILAIVYDAYRVIYQKNGSVLRTVESSFGASVPLFFDCSFFSPGGSLTNVNFGPLAKVTDINTPQIRAFAATDVMTTTASFVNITSLMNETNPGTAQVVAGINYTPEFTSTAVLTATYRLLYNRSGDTSPTGGFAEMSLQQIGSFNVAYQNSFYAPSTGPQDFEQSFTLSRRINVTAGVNVTHALQVAKLAPIHTCQVRNLELRVELIKL